MSQDWIYSWDIDCFGTWILTNLNLFRMVYFWSFFNEDWKNRDLEILWKRNTLAVLYHQPQMFISVDQLKRGSRQILVENKRSSEIWKFRFEMMDPYLPYQLSYHPEKIVKMDLVFLIVLQRIKTKLKPISNDLSPHAALTRP